MAFSSEQARRVRAGALVAFAVLVVGVAAAVLSGAFGSSTAPSERPVAGDADAGARPAGDSDHDLDDIDATYEPLVHQLQAKLDADPGDPAALLDLANGYFDWGMAAMGHAVDDAGRAHVEEVFGAAVQRYDAYLEGNSSKPALVDRAICLFYAGDHGAATEALEAFVESDASFAPAWANLGMFYESDGDSKRAADAYRRAIEVAGEDDAYGVRDYARQRLDALDQ